MTPDKKRYTLEEAHDEIQRIKNEMGFKEYQSKEQQHAFERGYTQAIIDMTTEFSKRSNLLLSINTSRPL
jgi:hypothetical protein